MSPHPHASPSSVPNPNAMSLIALWQCISCNTIVHWIFIDTRLHFFRIYFKIWFQTFSILLLHNLVARNHFWPLLLVIRLTQIMGIHIYAGRISWQDKENAQYTHTGNHLTEEWQNIYCIVHFIQFIQYCKYNHGYIWWSWLSCWWEEFDDKREAIFHPVCPIVTRTAGPLFPSRLQTSE